MNHTDALRIADDIRTAIAPDCEPDLCLTVGSLRRGKKDVGDIEIAGQPIPGAPRPSFGDTHIFNTRLDRTLYGLEKEGRLLRAVQNGEKKKKYVINTEYYGLKTLNPFHIEFYLVTPPAQWGVELVIRTGPGSQEDNFSKWCVTQRAQGGGMPDGYRQKHLAIWTADQLDAKFEPLKGEVPLPMPTEESFFTFLGLPYLEPAARHARWRRH